MRALADAVRHARHRSAPANPPFRPIDADAAAAAMIVTPMESRGKAGCAPKVEAPAALMKHRRSSEPALMQHSALAAERRRRARRGRRAEGRGGGVLRPHERRRREIAARGSKRSAAVTRAARRKSCLPRKQGRKRLSRSFLVRPGDSSGRRQGDHQRNGQSAFQPLMYGAGGVAVELPLGDVTGATGAARRGIRRPTRCCALGEGLPSCSTAIIAKRPCARHRRLA